MGKGKWERDKESRDSLRGAAGERGARCAEQGNSAISWNWWRRGEGGVRSGHEEDEEEAKNVRSSGHLKDFRPYGIWRWCSISPSLLLFGEGKKKNPQWRRGRGITFVSYSGARREELAHMASWKWGSSESFFLIDQSLSKGKGKRGKENKHSEMLIWNRHFREQIRLSNYHLCLRMTPLMWMRLRRLSLHSVNNENSN